MNIFAFIGSALVMCVMIITVEQLKPELSLLLAIACGIVMTVFLLGFVSPVIDEISLIASSGGIDSDMIAVVIKSFGICVAVQTASDLCRDSGQTAIAGKLELGGRLALLIVAMPLFRRLLDLALGIIGK
ncbi:MAG: hypothetical protein IIZ08_05480 [Clostridia bacterium]|nr:hypothetical protein [Clostridia bacterium]